MRRRGVIVQLSGLRELQHAREYSSVQQGELYITSSFAQA
jgi:hypothetical protein